MRRHCTSTTLSKLLSGVATLALGLSSAAVAEEGGGSAVQVDGVVVIGTLEEARLSTGSAVVIGPEELKTFEFANIHSILRSAPGVYVREEDGLGTFPRIGIRASSSGRSDRISIMEDGIPAAMAPYANTSAYYFPSAGRMSGVEVLKGPEILRYGPQTTSGAINLLSTRIPSEPSGFVNAEIGGWNTRRLHGWAGGMSGQVGALIETYQHRTDGFQNIDRSSRTAGNNVREYMLKLRWRAPEGAVIQQQLDLKLFKGDNEADVSYLGLTDADFRRDPDRRYGLGELERMDQGREAASLQHQIQFTPGISLISTAYYTDTFRNYTRLNQINGIAVSGTGITAQINNGAANAAFLQGILDGTQNTTHANGVRYGNNFQTFIAKGLSFEGRAAFSTGGLEHELLGGVRRHKDTTKNTATISNVIYNQVNGSLVFSRGDPGTPNRGYARATSFWIADRVRIGGLTLLPLVRHENVKTRANVALPTSARNALKKTTWGVGLNYQVSEDWTVLAGLHKGFAPPGSGAVEGSKGEESTNLEGGLRFRRGGLGIDVIGFYTDYDNALRNCLFANPCADGSVDGVQQDGAKEVYGLEVGVFANLFEGEGFRVPLRLAYTYTDGEYTRAADIASGVRKGDVLDYTPKHIGRLELGVDHDVGFKLNLAFNYSDGTCINTTCGRAGVDTRFLKTQNLFTADVSASYAITQSVDIYARVENLFDERKITHRGTDGARGNPARYVGGGVRVSF
ncbi:TonB-dependent receptor [Phenylobacterium sp.]|uniref:TonB-dependent receptor family protein n=1 Tax=Phenylobacterium sp. TaxID=1871053 RepID=UPI00301E44BD